MIRGISKRVIVVNSPNPQLFEKAIFIMNDNAFSRKGTSREDIIKQAQEIANNYVKENTKKGKSLLCLPPPLYAAAGAVMTGIVWLCSRLIVF